MLMCYLIRKIHKDEILFYKQHSLKSTINTPGNQTLHPRVHLQIDLWYNSYEQEKVEASLTTTTTP